MVYVKLNEVDLKCDDLFEGVHSVRLCRKNHVFYITAQQDATLGSYFVKNAKNYTTKEGKNSKARDTTVVKDRDRFLDSGNNRGTILWRQHYITQHKI